MSNAVDVTLGAYVRTLRIAHGLSQAGLGDALGVSAQQVQKYESGANRMTPATILGIAKLFGVPVSALFASLEEPVSTAAGGPWPNVLRDPQVLKLACAYAGATGGRQRRRR